MTKEEFIKIINELKFDISVVLVENFLLNQESKYLLKNDKNLEKIFEKNFMLKQLNISNIFLNLTNELKDCFENDKFSPLCFQMSQLIMITKEINPSTCVEPLVHLFNIGMNHKHQSGELSDEKYEHLRRYISEDEQILPVNPLESKMEDFTNEFCVQKKLVKVIINECNKKYFKSEKNKPSKAENKNLISKVSKKELTVEEMNKENKRKKMAYNEFRKYLVLVNNKYVVVYPEFLKEEEIINLMRLAKDLGISEENQKQILCQIVKHNDLIDCQNNDRLSLAKQEEFNKQGENIKNEYFTPIMWEQYNLILDIINCSELSKKQSLNYIINKLKIVKDGIDEIVSEAINGELLKDDILELFEISFDDARLVLEEAKYYENINEILLKKRKK